MILLLEDDPAIADTVAFALRREGFEVEHRGWLAEARERLARAPAPQLLILDVGLPDGHGLDLCRELRAGPLQHLPVIVLSARSEEMDRVLGLELGADDYLAKPFSPRELAARVKALLRRAAVQAPAPLARTAPFHDDRAGQRMYLHGQPLALTRREYRLLACLLTGAGRIHARDALLAAAWGDESDSQDRTVDTHIKTLRAKLREADPARDYISTHRGMGYSLDV